MKLHCRLLLIILMPFALWGCASSMYDDWAAEDRSKAYGELAFIRNKQQQQGLTTENTSPDVFPLALRLLIGHNFMTRDDNDWTKFRWLEQNKILVRETGFVSSGDTATGTTYFWYDRSLDQIRVTRKFYVDDPKHSGDFFLTEQGHGKFGLSTMSGTALPEKLLVTPTGVFVEGVHNFYPADKFSNTYTVRDHASFRSHLQAGVRQEQRKRNAENNALWSAAAGGFQSGLQQSQQQQAMEDRRQRQMLNEIQHKSRAAEKKTNTAKNNSLKNSPASAQRSSTLTKSQQKAQRSAQAQPPATEAQNDEKKTSTTGTSLPANAQPAKPLRFVLRKPMVEAVNNRNAHCFSNIVTVPGPAGWGTPARKSVMPARAIIERYIPSFEAKCAAKGKTRGVTDYIWNDVRLENDPDDLYRKYRGWGFPEVRLP